MKIKTWRDPYDSGFSLTRPTEIEINPGLTVLVGCNGAGKTTLLHNIQEEMKSQKIPCHKYDNLHDGGYGDIISSVLGGYKSEYITDNMGLAVNMWTASEGECIKLNLGRQSSLYKEFFTSGYYKNRSYQLSTIFDKTEEEIVTKQRVLLFDAVDSGLSVDSIIEIKNLFELILKDAEKLGIELYLIISANEYELCRESQCFNVNAGKYLTFTDYEDYRNFIIKSRIKKEKRIEKQALFYQKRREKQQKEYDTLKAKNNAKIEKIRDQYKDKEIPYSQNWKIRELEREIEDLAREYGIKEGEIQ